MASPDEAYAAAVLAIYLVLLVPATYNTWKHGTQGLAWVGWGYFVVFCSLRIIGSAMQISNPTSAGAAIISSIGLSPLTIATGGILHEARFYLLSLRDKPEAKKRELSLILVFHVAVASAIALLAIGASGLSSAKDQADATRLNRDLRLAGGGALILIAVIALLLAGAISSYRVGGGSGSVSGSNSTTSSKHRPQQQKAALLLGRRLVIAVGLACPLLLVRVAGSAAYFLGGASPGLSPVAGSWGCRVGLYLVPEVLSAVTLLAGGLAARDVSRCEGGRGARGVTVDVEGGGSGDKLGGGPGVREG